MRVIAGALGGRRLLAPAGRSTRPTSDRAREAMFSILGDLEGHCVLDLYAGSGALGIEALSRGASFAVFVEESRPALQAMRSNLRALQLEAQSTVVAMAVERLTPRQLERGPFDLILCDPPWAKLEAAVAALGRVAVGQLSSEGQLVLEHAAADAPVLPAALGLSLAQRRRWGDTGASFFARIDAVSP
ncbi:MAG TPA: 16S rRNA (guanine(966)-N(2))-methyltransferase RsmD [Polyangiaceae bacterium]|nr:16S rRNA (guanine(966)-N(2))-methyltransferase RsmD [Polyangiaceae bacterium]